MSLVRIKQDTDYGSEYGRWQLFQQSKLVDDALRRLEEEMQKVKEADQIVRPTILQEFPVAAGQIYTGEEGGEIGDITIRSVQSAPVGMLECDGSAVSRTTYADLFAKISTTFGAGNGTTTFNLPDLRGRVPAGIGTGDATSATAWSMAQKRGDEVHSLTAAEGPAHTHTMAHTHDISHTHAVYTGASGSGDHFQRNNSGTLVTSVGDQNGTTSGAASNSTTSSSGSGTGHNNLQPSLGLAFYIRFRLGPSDTIQTLPISWGKLNAQWQLDTLKNFPKTSVDNDHEEVITGNRPEAVVNIAATGGTESGNTSALKIVGVVMLPHNFRGFRADAFGIRTKIDSSGCPTSSSCTVTLKVSDPQNAGSFLSNTYTRTINESSGSIDDGEWIDAKLKGQDLGPDWRPGYMFRFELEISHPKTFTTANISVGRLYLDWSKWI